MLNGDHHIIDYHCFFRRKSQKIVDPNIDPGCKNCVQFLAGNMCDNSLATSFSGRKFMSSLSSCFPRLIRKKGNCCAAQGDQIGRILAY